MPTSTHSPNAAKHQVFVLFDRIISDKRNTLHWEYLFHAKAQLEQARFSWSLSPTAVIKEGVAVDYISNKPYNWNMDSGPLIFPQQPHPVAAALFPRSHPANLWDMGLAIISTLEVALRSDQLASNGPSPNTTIDPFGPRLNIQRQSDAQEVLVQSGTLTVGYIISLYSRYQHPLIPFS